jgi:DNA-binding transcriptional ArsR family regulator
VRSVDQLADLLKTCRSPISRPKIREATGLSENAVRRWVNALVENGILIEVERDTPDPFIKGPMKRGSPPRQFVLAFWMVRKS